MTKTATKSKPKSMKEKVDAAIKIECMHCSTLNSKKDKFCIECGNDLTINSTAGQSDLDEVREVAKAGGMEEEQVEELIEEYQEENELENENSSNKEGFSYTDPQKTILRQYTELDAHIQILKREKKKIESQVNEIFTGAEFACAAGTLSFNESAKKILDVPEEKINMEFKEAKLQDAKDYLAPAVKLNKLGKKTLLEDPAELEGIAHIETVSRIRVVVNGKWRPGQTNVFEQEGTCQVVSIER